MQIERKLRASSTKLSENDWNDLVASLNGNLDLALAARIFYLTHPHSTHSFDYYVPNHFDYDNVPQEVAEYLNRARVFVSMLKEAHANPDRNDESYWFIAAQLVGSLNLTDHTSFERKQ